MSDPILNISETSQIDDSIKSLDYSEIVLQSNVNINTPSQTLTFTINNQNTIFLPSESRLKITGTLTKADGTLYANGDEVTLINNAMMYLFSSISYKLGSTEIESISNPGQATSMLGYLSYPDDFSTSAGLKYCWSKDTNTSANSNQFSRSPAVPQVAAGAPVPSIAAGTFTPKNNPEYNQGFATRKSYIFSLEPKGSFEFIIPFDHIFGFAALKKIIYGVKHTLTLVRANDNDAIYRRGTDAGKINLSNISWLLPEVELNPLYEGAIMEKIRNKETFPIQFPARTCENISMPQARSFDWRLSVQGGIEKPRWIIFGFQTDKLLNQERNPAVFDHCNLKDVTVRLNTKRYPKNDLNINFASGQISVVCDNFDNFKKNFYGYDSLVGGTQVNLSNFKDLFPIIVVNVSRQDETFRESVVDMQVKLIFNAILPDLTQAYAVIISDRSYMLSSDGISTPLVSK